MLFRILQKFEFLFHETFLGLRRGGWMNWATISTVSILIFLFGTCFLASWRLEAMLNHFGSQLEISVYLKSQTPTSSLENTILTVKGVTSVKPVTKEEAWIELVRDLGISDIEEATSQLHGNPLVDEIKVKVSTAEDAPIVAEAIRNIEGVDEVKYVQEVITRLSQLNRGLKIASSFIIVILTFTSTSIIMITIRLTILARKREIEVMQLVGAYRSWIYFPFVFQGALLGFAGASIACSFLYITYQVGNNILSQQAQFIQYINSSLELPSYQVLFFTTALISLGSGLGFLGSILAVDKFSLR